ncbi:hypothetical protein [Amycolatopsis sp. lyj-90]|uniref:hypothetical protein n=1 Tax=Amycolatopsis sp. lyj-90 TaxID=2789285 RepID=UPI00397DD340
MRAGDLDGARRDIDAAEDLTRALGLRYMEFEIRLGRTEIHRRSGSTGQSYDTCTFVIGAPDGSHTLTVHTNNDWATFPLLDAILEAEFGASGVELKTLIVVVDLVFVADAASIVSRGLR